MQQRALWVYMVYSVMMQEEDFLMQFSKIFEDDDVQGQGLVV